MNIQYRCTTRSQTPFATCQLSTIVSFNPIIALQHAHIFVWQYIQRHRQKNMNAQYFFDLGMSFIEKDKFKEALTSFEKSTRLQPDFADANFGIGVCKIKLGDKAKGEAAIRKAAQLGCKEAQLYFDTHHEPTINTCNKTNNTATNNYGDRESIDLFSNRRIKNMAASSARPLDVATDLMNFSLAARWPRFFARIFDLWWEVLIVAFALAKIGLYSEFVKSSKDTESAMLFGLICLPVALALDASVYGLFENTPGKAWQGLKVSTIDCKALSFIQYLARNFSIWAKGLALGIPLFNLFTMHDQYNRLGKGRQTNYDEPLEYIVYMQPTGAMRKASFGLAFALLFLCIIASSKYFPFK